MRITHKGKVPIVAFAVAMSLALAGCGDSDGGSDADSQGGASSNQSALEKLVPEKIRAAGVLRVATPAASQPASFLKEDAKTVQGVFPELMEAVGDRLGLKVEFEVTPFPGLFPGLDAARFDAVGGNVYDTPEREGTYALVAYQKDFDAVLVDSGIQTLDDLCGKTVGALAGGAAIANIKSLSGKCTSSNKPAITVRTFPSLPDANTAVKSGAVDGATSSFTTASYLVDTALKGSGLHVLQLPEEEPNIYAVGFTNDNKALASAFAAAIKDLIDSGDYEKILSAWDSYSDISALETSLVGVNKSTAILAAQ